MFTQASARRAVAGRRHAAVERHAELSAQRLDDRLRVHDVGVRRRSAETMNSKGVLTLARRFAAAKNSGDVMMVRTTSRRSPPGVEKPLRRAVDQRRRRLVGDEPLGQLVGDVVRRGRVRREHVEDAFALLLAAAGGEVTPRIVFSPRVVHPRVEREPAALPRAGRSSTP